MQADKAITYNEYKPGAHAYVSQSQLAILSRRFGYSRRWSFDASTSTIQVAGTTDYIKSFDKFDRHWPYPESFAELLRESRDYGCLLPTSYASVFHARFHSPRVRRSYNALFRPCFRAGWQEARQYGLLSGEWHTYDLNSAYLWASTQGLPVIDSVRKSVTIGRLPGLYRLVLREPRPNLPFPFNTYTEVNATTEEIDAYGLPIAHILGGVTWSDYEPADHCLRYIADLSFAKQTGRSYWGRWASRQSLQCHTVSKSWCVPNPVENFIWASVVVSKPKIRIWHDAPGAAHVFVDSVITDRPLSTGGGLGDWRHTGSYENLVIRGPGQYGVQGQPPLKMAGISPTNRGVM